MTSEVSEVLLSSGGFKQIEHRSSSEIALEAIFLVFGWFVLLLMSPIVLLASFMVFIAVFFGSLCGCFKKVHPDTSQIAPEHPLVGHLIHFLRNSMMLRNPANAFLTLAHLDKSKEGVLISFGVVRPGCMQLITDATSARNILDQCGYFFKGPGYDAFRTVTPRHLPGLDGEIAVHLRNFYVDAVTPQLDNIAALAHKVNLVLIEEVVRRTDGGERVNIPSLLRERCLSIIYQAAFGVSIYSATSSENIFLSAIHFLMNEWHERVIAVVPWHSISFFPRNWSVIRARQVVDSYLSEKSKAKKPGVATCFLDGLINSGLSDSDTSALLFTFIAMGHENVSSSLSWVWYHLLRHGDSQLETEAAEALKDLPSTLSWQFLTTLVSQKSAMQDFMNEILRLYPAVPMLSRKDNRAGEDAKEILICPYVLQRLPIWGDPEIFRPERWNKISSDSVEMQHFIPFGSGGRGCLGQKIGRIQMHAAILSFAKQDLWSKISLENDSSLEPEMKISLRAPDFCVVSK